MASAASSGSLSKVLKELESACKGDKALSKAVSSLKEVINLVEEGNEKSLHAAASELSELAAPASKLQSLLAAHPLKSFAVLSELLRLLKEGLRGVLEKKIDRQELSKGDMRKVESWEEVLDGALKMIENYLCGSADRTNAEKTTFGNSLFASLSDLLKFDPAARKIRPSFLRRIMELFATATAKHDENKIRLSRVDCLGPHVLAAILSAASDSEFTSQALELAFRIGGQVYQVSKDKATKAKWYAHVWPEKEYGKDAKKLVKMMVDTQVNTYEKAAPEILDFLSSRSLTHFQSFRPLRLSAGGRTFVHSDSEQGASSNSFDGPVSFNLTSFTASVSGVSSGGDDDEFAEVLEFNWESVDRTSVEEGEGAKTVVVKFYLSEAPLLDDEPLLPSSDQGVFVVEFEVRNDALAQLKKVLETRKVPLPSTAVNPAPSPTAPPLPPDKHNKPLSSTGPAAAPSATSNVNPPARTEKVVENTVKKPAGPVKQPLKGEKSSKEAPVRKRVLLPQEEGDAVEEVKPPPTKKKRSSRSAPTKSATPWADEPSQAVPAAELVFEQEEKAEVAAEGEEEDGELEETLTRLAQLSKDRQAEVVELLRRSQMEEHEDENQGEMGGFDAGFDGDGDEMELDPFTDHYRHSVTAIGPPAKPIKPLPSLRFPFARPTAGPSDFTSPSMGRSPLAGGREEVENGSRAEMMKEMEGGKEREGMSAGLATGADAEGVVGRKRAEEEVAEALDQLSSIILTSFSRRLSTSSTFLTSSQTSFTSQLRRSCAPFTSETSTLVAAARLALPLSRLPPGVEEESPTTAKGRLPAYVDEQVLPTLLEIAKKSRNGIEEVKELVSQGRKNGGGEGGGGGAGKGGGKAGGGGKGLSGVV